MITITEEGFMKRRVLLVCLFISAIMFGGLTVNAQGKSKDRLEMYTVTAGYTQAASLVRAGYDVVASRDVGTGIAVDLVLSPSERDRLVRQGYKLDLKRNRAGKTVTQLADEQAASGFTVWRSYDEPGGIRDQLYQIARDNRQLVKLEVIGHTIQGREIIALKVTNNAREVRDGRRPAVLYSALQHAREWISGEVDRRLLNYYINQWKAGNPEIKDLLKTREFWFVVVANPDGYQYTFDVERLWRKNLRDNDGDGQITNADGVDPNRNWPAHWNYDEEGSSSLFANDTYRGTGPASEPETRALKGLLDRVGFKFQVNYHSYGPYLLYPEGWQVGTPTADDPIYRALSGDLANPAIEGFYPGLASDVLYVTNGETTDYAHTNAGTLAWTPELEEGCDGCGFVFPDDEALIQAEFELNLPFALDVAKSALDPSKPVSHLGNTTQPFYVEKFDYSYGDPQLVEVDAARWAGEVKLKYRINGGHTHSASTEEWDGGERYGNSRQIYYRRLRGEVHGTRPGDRVTVWFEGGGQVSESFTYTAEVESRNPVLVIAAEDYSGASTFPPGYPAGPGPHYLSYYASALAANGIGYDIYDVDAHNRKAPDHLGVLSHYKAVVWYTGNDAVTREPGWGPGNASKLANDEILNVRAFLNEGGRLLYTGKLAGHQYTLAHGNQLYDPVANQQCRADPNILPRCLSLAGSGDFTNDFLEYWLGAYILNENAGTTGTDCDPATGAACTLFDTNGLDRPFQSKSWTFNGDDSAQNQNHSASFIATSGILPAATYPQFTSWVAAKYNRPGGAFDPHSGQYYVYSQIADVSYKRLTRTISVPASGANLSFWVSRNTEQDWDFMFVEAHTVGQDDWTTLADQNGHTSTDTGQSCPAGWNVLHPFLNHYQTLNVDGTCSPTGTTGAWNAASGSSGGWEQWSVDLSAYAGKQVEVSIAYASDWSTQGLGVFLDDIAVSTGEGSTDFESDLGGWVVTGPPPGSAPQGNNFIRMTASGFPEGAVITTRDTLYFGFGFEGISDAQTRKEVMQRAMRYLLR
jgi:murein tripeptide amidase MpaA